MSGGGYGLRGLRGRGEGGDMSVLVTRKDVMRRAGVTARMWQRARSSGGLQPACGNIYKRSPYFLAADVARVFGIGVEVLGREKG